MRKRTLLLVLALFAVIRRLLIVAAAENLMSNLLIHLLVLLVLRIDLEHVCKEVNEEKSTNDLKENNTLSSFSGFCASSNDNVCVI